VRCFSASNRRAFSIAITAWSAKGLEQRNLFVVKRPDLSPGCAVSRARTDLSGGELTCAFHASALPEIVRRLERSAAVDNAVAEYVVANDRQHFMALS
jgi:hypothetical protein